MSGRLAVIVYVGAGFILSHAQPVCRSGGHSCARYCAGVLSEWQTL